MEVLKLCKTPAAPVHKASTIVQDLDAAVHEASVIMQDSRAAVHGASAIVQDLRALVHRGSAIVQGLRAVVHGASETFTNGFASQWRVIIKILSLALINLYALLL